MSRDDAVRAAAGAYWAHAIEASGYGTDYRWSCSCGTGGFHTDSRDAHRITVAVDAAAPHLTADLVRERDEALAKVDGLRDELAIADVRASNLEAEVERLRGGRDICIYCGWSCSRSEAPEALAGHVRSCPEHPMRKVEAKVAAVEAVVEQYGDDYEPEDRWRYTRDLRAALRGDE